MRKFVFVSVMCLVLGACSDDSEPVTWGDISLQLGESYCGALSGCGFDVKPACAEHVQWHECVPDNSCDVELPDEAQVAMDICDARLGAASDEDCALLWYGYVPTECDPVFGFDPGPQD